MQVFVSEKLKLNNCQPQDLPSPLQSHLTHPTQSPPQSQPTQPHPTQPHPTQSYPTESPPQSHPSTQLPLTSQNLQGEEEKAPKRYSEVNLDEKKLKKNSELDLIGWLNMVTTVTQDVTQEPLDLSLFDEQLPSVPPSSSEFFNRIVTNLEGKEKIVHVFGKDFIVPKLSAFFLGDISNIHKLSENFVPRESVNHVGFRLIVLDPPWDSKSVKRSKKYDSLPNHVISSIPIPNLSSSIHGTFIVVWITNNPKLYQFVINNLFVNWGVQFVTTWYWFKVTNNFEPVIPISCTQRKPYEPFIIGYFPPKNTKNCTPMFDTSTKVIFSVPGIHSNKPNLRALFDEKIPENSLCLEIFARNLFPGFTSFGNEAIKFQEMTYFTKKEKKLCA